MYHAIVTLCSPLAHNGDTAGISTLFNRQKIMGPDNTPLQIPFYSGNAMRGLLRDHATLFMLEALGYVTDDNEITEKLSANAFYLFFTGGALEKTGGNYPLERMQYIRDLIPALGLLGGAYGNTIIQGRLEVGQLLPIVQECAHLLPEWIEAPALSTRDILQTNYYTRMDDGKRDAGKYLEAVKESPTQMRYELETMVAGAKLYWHFGLDRANRLEELAWWSALWHWSQTPFIGGKSAVGHGEIMIEFESGERLNPNENLPDVSEYTVYLETHADEIKAVLNEL